MRGFGASRATRACRVHMKVNNVILTAALLVGPFLISATHVDLGISVGTPPPPPPVVAVGPVGVAPGPAYVWVPGYWDWIRGRWVWVDGHWVLPPRVHAVWVPPAVEYRLHRGHWR
jgi:hypothetical protein